jgi:hypothetical protein
LDCGHDLGLLGLIHRHNTRKPSILTLRQIANLLTVCPHNPLTMVNTLAAKAGADMVSQFDFDFFGHDYASAVNASDAPVMRSVNSADMVPQASRE